MTTFTLAAVTYTHFLLYAASCDGFQCGGGRSNKVCRMRHGQPRCVCAADCVTLLNGARSRSVSAARSSSARQRMSVTAEALLAGRWHGPVCALDGHTHRNPCALAKFNCRSGRNLPVDYVGQCQSQFVTSSLAAKF